jgi:hypothetical protein
MENELPLIGALIAMLAVCWWGCVFLYISYFFRKHNIAFHTSLQYLIFFLRGDIRKLYTSFYKARKEVGHSKASTLFIIFLHLFSPLLFFIGPLLAAKLL